MTDGFDAYAEWLQIPVDRRPPTHYELLGLPEFEEDSQRIYQAAKERIAVLRRYQLGQRAAEALRLQSEVSQALDCLKTPAAKERYDETLRAERQLPSDMALDPVRSSTAARPAADPAPRPVLPSRPPAAANTQRPTIGAWFTSPLGVSLLVAGSILLLAGVLLGARLALTAGSTKAVRVTDTRRTASEPSKVHSADESPPTDELTPLIAEAERLAGLLEADLPASVEDILLAGKYGTPEDLRSLADEAETTRSDLQSDPRLEKLRGLSARIDSRASRATARMVKDRLSKIQSRLREPIATNPKFIAELDALDELQRVQRSWKRLELSEATRSRANQILASQNAGAGHGLAWLAACALLHENALAAGPRRAMLDAWQTGYSDEERAALCQALLLSGDKELVNEAVQRINQEPQLLGHYNAEDLLPLVENNGELWQPARSALSDHFGGSHGDRLASIFGPADPPDRKPETVSVPTTPSLYSPPSGPGKWTTIIALAKGKPLLPDEVNLEKNELATIERGLPENAFKYANPKSPKGALLIHSTYSLKRGDSLSLDGWTICRHDNGSPKLAVQFDNDNRKGPLRLWDADTKLRLYASYTNDRLHGPACLFENGKPSIVMNYVGNQLKDKYLVDYQSGRPVARPVEELPPDLAQTWAAGEKQFEELSDEIKQQEIKFKKALKSAFEEYQRNLITMRSQKKRQRDKMNETRSRAEWQASAARTIGAMAIGAGGGF